MRHLLALAGLAALLLAAPAAALPDAATGAEPRVVTLCLLAHAFDPTQYPGCVAAGLTCVAQGYWNPFDYGLMCWL